MRRWVLAAALALIAGAAAAEPIYQSISPRALLDILDREEGEAALDIVIGGDTTIEGAVDGRRYVVYFYGCDGAGFDALAGPDSDCTGYEFRSYFPEADEAALYADWVNAWNDANHYGALWLDHDGDAAAQLNVIVEGGVTEANMRASFTWWRRVLASAAAHLEEVR